MNVKQRKKFFFEPFWATRFSLRFATSSGRKNQKTFVGFYTGCCNVPREQKVFCGAFLQKSDRLLSGVSP